jgi:hypothetical protein
VFSVKGGNQNLVACIYPSQSPLMRQFAAPLKVSASSKSDTGNTGSSSGLGSGSGSGNAFGSRIGAGTTGGANKGKGIGSTTTTSPLGPAKIEEISSPHELTAYVRYDRSLFPA